MPQIAKALVNKFVALNCIMTIEMESVALKLTIKQIK